MRIGLLAALCVPIFLLCSPAFAYVGPGAGLSAIGTVLALIASVFLAIVGFIWYPIKRLLRRFRSDRTKTDTPTDPATPDS